MELLLLVFFCLLTGSEVTFGAENEEIIKDVINGTTVIRVDEGRDVTLRCSLRTKEDITNKKFVWKKDGRQVFLYDAGDHSNNVNTGQDQQFIQRVSHFRDKLKSGDASITIRDMKMADSGKYTCDFPDHRGEIFLIVLVVDGNSPAAAKPSVRILKQTKFNAVLQCEVQGVFPKPELHWQDGAEKILPAEEPQVTKRRGHYNIILITNVTKTDYYRCVATQKEINKMTHYETHVYIHVKAPQPSVRKEQWWFSTTVQCEIRGVFPKPEFHWEDRAGNKLHAKKLLESERQGLYDIILQTTVTKTDNYTCVVTQEEINQQAHADIDVSVPGLPPGAIVLIVIGGAVFVAVALVVTVYKCWDRIKCCFRNEPAATTAPTAPGKGSAQDPKKTDRGDIDETYTVPAASWLCEDDNTYI